MARRMCVLFVWTTDTHLITTMQQSLIQIAKRILTFRWWTGSVMVPFVFYAIFILFILTVTFPLRSNDDNTTKLTRDQIKAAELKKHDELVQTIKERVVHERQQNDVQVDSVEGQELIAAFALCESHKCFIQTKPKKKNGNDISLSEPI